MNGNCVYEKAEVFTGVETVNSYRHVLCFILQNYIKSGLNVSSLKVRRASQSSKYLSS